MKPTITLNGVDYVTAREIEAHYMLSRKRAWMELQKAKLNHVKLLQTHFYTLADAREYFDRFVLDNPRYNKIGLAK